MNGAAGVARGAKKAQRAKDAAEVVMPTSRAARREAMRRAGIPTSQQPSGQLRTKAGIQYRYEMHGPEGRQTAIVTDQTTDRVKGHGPHWEAGWAKDEHDRDPLNRLRVRNGKSKVDYKRPNEADDGRREARPEATAASKSPP